MLEIGPAPAADAALLEAWRARIARVTRRLGWTERRCVVRHHAGGASLALAAPWHALFLATEIDEWALCAALAEQDPRRGPALEAALAAAQDDEGAAADPPVLAEAAAFERFLRLAASETNPALRSLHDAALPRRLPFLLDEDAVTVGSGAGGRSYPAAAPPAAGEVPWERLHGVPTVLVTGSNGKTTTVRLIAACARAHGRHVGYNCTDGVYIDAVELAGGDYSGPAGARRVLRDRRTEAAVLETARGGILRRGLAVAAAQAAVVTNVSSDHFGEYGIDDLAALADVKLTVAATIADDGLLILNADDAMLAAKARELAHRFGRSPPLGWFALDAGHPALCESRARGGGACGGRDGRLLLSWHGEEADLGAIAAMPLTVGGGAAYNIANLAGAALAAAALGVPAATIGTVYAAFGSSLHDNPGRLMQFDRNGTRVLVDYAHNPDGLRGVLELARGLRGAGRLGVLLGQAGNRKDADIEAVARVVAEFRPDLVVVKENEAQLRGRAPGEVPRILRAELRRQGYSESSAPVCDSELDAVRFALDWAGPGDVLVMPVHSAAARAAALAILGAPP